MVFLLRVTKYRVSRLPIHRSVLLNNTHRGIHMHHRQALAAARVWALRCWVFQLFGFKDLACTGWRIESKIGVSLE